MPGSDVGSAVGVAVGSTDAVAVGPGVAPGDGMSGEARFCGPGDALANQSIELSLVSDAFPAFPPGRRSRLDDAGGAGATVPSTKAFVASPHPIASTTAPPTTRSATAPPVAAKPPVKEASPRPTNEPAPLTTRIRWPDARMVDTVHVALRVTVEPLDVAYTSSRPIRSVGPAPWFAISTNSSDALDPPVCSSDTTRVDGGHGTVAASATVAPVGIAAAGRLDRHRATTRRGATARRAPDALHA